ncbi:MAG TPA: hypothetical protein VKY89_16365 [Thermoanaerobaculia bacterium]|jgi:hypothetical protein|nr:hypothetical protein [Thermoanaerobaculia bacterium]
MGVSNADVSRAREALSSLIDLSELSRREIERRLSRQGCGLDLNRLLSGKFELRLRQILDVIRVLDIHPLEFFRLVFKEPERRNPLLEKMQTLFASVRPPAVAGPMGGRPAEKDLEELRHRVDQLAQLVEQLRARSR